MEVITRSDLASCKICKVEKPRYRIAGSPYPSDGEGRWYGKVCYPCNLAIKATDNRKRGVKPRDAATNPAQVKGVRAEQFVQAHYESLGFAVTRTTSAGPDLLVTGNGSSFTVEVKSAVRARPQRGSWYVGPVRPARRSDDFVAIVLPDNTIHIEAMAGHLAACNPSGNRCVTKLIRKAAA
jgi:hypothetical protein